MISSRLPRGSLNPAFRPLHALFSCYYHHESAQGAKISISDSGLTTEDTEDTEEIQENDEYDLFARPPSFSVYSVVLSGVLVAAEQCEAALGL
jgi:hypothetical protein